MKKQKIIKKLLDDFNKVKSTFSNKEELDIINYGEYRLGLINEEIEHYIEARCSLPQYKNKFKNIKKAITKFWDIAGVNTMAINSLGEPLMYRHDVLRFAGVLFNREKTYWD